MDEHTQAMIKRIQGQRRLNGFVLTKVKLEQRSSEWYETKEEIPEEFCVRFRLRREDGKTIAYGFLSPRHPVENPLKQWGAFRCCSTMQIFKNDRWKTINI